MDEDELMYGLPGPMSSYRAGGAGTGPISPDLAGAQQRAEQLAAQRRQQVSAPGTASQVLSQREVFLRNNPDVARFVAPRQGNFEVISAADRARADARADATTQRGNFEVISAADRARAMTAPDAQQQVNSALAAEIRRGLQNGVVTASGRAITPGNVRTPVNSAGDMAAVTARMQEANAIRQRAIDARNAAANPGLSLQDQINRAISNAPQQAVPQGRRGWGVSVRLQDSIRDANAQARGDAVSGLLSSAEGQRASALAAQEAQTGMMRSALDNQALLQRQQLSNEGALAAAQARNQFDPRESLFESYLSAIEGGDPEAANRLLDMSSALDRVMAEDEAVGYANGGVVQGAAAMAAPNAGAARQDVDRYREYVLAARQAGAPVVSFGQFSTLGMGAPKTAMTFAEGGMVPDPSDVSGKMVVDTNPSAPTDSIPAVVDGAAPAKLDSGEFVLPKDVVMFFGTDRLNKMIAAARKPNGEAVAQ